MSEVDRISPERRAKLFAQWEEIGLSLIEQDLANGGYVYIGGPPEVRKLAREWVLIKKNEILSVKPSCFGISVDFKALSLRLRIWVRRQN